MKVIYSYIPYNSHLGEEKMPLHLCLLLYASVTRTLMYFDEVILYTNEFIEQQLKPLNIPFTRVDTKILKDERALCPSIPKLRAYAAQNEPYIHIDLDTIFFHPLLFNPHQKVIFAHLDVSPNQLNSKPSDFEEVAKAYLDPIFNGPLPDYYKDLKITSIPNMNIVVVNDPTWFANKVNKVIKLYENNKAYFDTDYYRFCTIEQLAITAEINQDNDYKNIIENNLHILHPKLPTSILNSEIPMKIKSEGFNKRIIEINKLKDLVKLKDENFGGYLHLVGELKENSIIQAVILQDIINREGKDFLYRLSKSFRDLSYFNSCFDLLNKINVLNDEDISLINLEKQKDDRNKVAHHIPTYYINGKIYEPTDN